MALAQYAGEHLLMRGEIEPIEDAVAGVEAVTAGDIQRLAKRLIRGDNMAMAVVGPGASEPELSELLAA
jgi:predicted Zn-dependent peptidase